MTAPLAVRSSRRVALLVAEAQKRRDQVKGDRRALASWWQDILTATERLADGAIDADRHRLVVLWADKQRRVFLRGRKKAGGA